MKKFYENPEIELIKSISFIATSDLNSHDNLDDYGNGDGDDAGDLFSGINN